MSDKVNLVVCCLMLAVMPALGQIREDQVAPITVYTRFLSEPSAGVVDSLKAETESIMSEMGLTFGWRSLENHGSEVSVELAVVTFNGKCAIAAASQGHSGTSTALGWTHVSDGQVLPFSEVDCDRIRAFIQPEFSGMPAKEREAVFGRAIGRVLSHELYHVFAKTVHHGSRGVAKPRYCLSDLVSEEFHFLDGDLGAARARIKRETAPRSPGGPTPASADSVTVYNEHLY